MIYICCANCYHYSTVLEDITPVMVSTRGVRYKFTEGERVLCYEPDPTKAKVLYDSKVLEVIESKDKRGRRTVEYLIHFQGWNSSWDRCVSEDFVLKDTEENRQLQRDLAEKSQLQLGAYLYRRERKKGNSTNSGSGPAKRPRHGFSDDGSSTSTQPDGDEGETGDTDSSSGSGSSNQPHSPPNSHNGRASIVLPSALRDRLTFDYHLVVKRGRLSRLPAVPCAAQILESFVKWFARAGAWNPPRARHDPHHRPHMRDVSCRLNLLREVADGLRVYFDFILRGHLLYKQELDQYHEICGQYIDEPDIKTEPDEEDDNEQDTSQDEALVSLEDMKSPKIPEYSHLPPDPNPDSNTDVKPDIKLNLKLDLKPDLKPDSNHNSRPSCNKIGINNSDRRNDIVPNLRPNSRHDSRTNLHSNTHSGENGADNHQNNITEADRDNHIERRGELITPKVEMESEPEAEAEPEVEAEMEIDETEEKVDNGNARRSSPRPDRETRPLRHHALARRLRSHKSAVSQSENEEPAPSTSTGEQRTFETLSSSVGSSGSSLSEGWSRGARAAPPPAPPPRNPLSQLLDKVGKWQIIPRQGTEHLPCRVYGAIHLARLFVKLPDFLNATQMPDFKLKLILKHIDMFVQYLDEHSEWFGEMYYVNDGVSRSH